MKRCLAILLCMGMLFALVPWSAVVPVAAADAGSAQPVETLSDMRELLEQTGEQEAAVQEDTGGFGLLDLTVAGKVATVTYTAPEDATIIVAIYTEDGKQLRASGNAPAIAQEKTVQVQLSGSTSGYFQAAAYLVRTADLTPLCDPFRTSRYTRDMQDLLSSTVNSYAQDRVINLDADVSTNFVVMQKGVVQVKSTETTNLFTSVDRENNRYVVENADKTVTGLQVGGHLVHLLADNSWIITKVAAVSVDGMTVTIQGEAPNVEEVFSHVKLENKGTVAQMEIDESTLGKGVTYKGIVTPPPAARTMSLRAMEEPDLFFETESGTQIPLAEFEIELEVEGETAGGDAEGELTTKASVFVGFEVTDNFYMVNGNCVSGKQIDSGVKLSAKLEGKLAGKALKLGEWKWEPIPFVVSVGFEPFIGVELSGGFEAEMKAVASMGLYYDRLAGGYCNTKAEPKVDANVELEGELFVGLDLNPTFEVLEGVLLDADATAMVGLFFTGDLVGTAHGDYAELPTDPNVEQPKQLHSCEECIDGELFAGMKLGLEIEMAGLPITRTAESKLFWARKLSDFFVRLDSLAHPTHGLGTCPERRFLVTVEALDMQGNPIADGAVTATRTIDDLLNMPFAKEMGTTNINGIVSNYIPGGWYTFDVNGDTDTDNYVHITGTGKVRIDGKDLIYTSSEPGDSIAPLLEKIMDAGAVVASGKKGTIAWSMTQGGFLSITGTGELTEVLWSGAPVRPKVVSIGEGITGIVGGIFGYQPIFAVTFPSTLKTIGSGAFAYTDLVSVVIPEGVTIIEMQAFAGCTDLENVVLPESLTAIGERAFYNCYALNNVILPRGVTRIESDTFRSCQKLTRISLGNRVTVIGNGAFDDCSSLSVINIPASVTELGDYAFANCALTHVTLPEQALTLGFGTFWYCEQLQSVQLPSELKEIADSLFRGCKSLTSLNMPANLEKIGIQAFCECQSLTSVLIPESVTEIGNSAFLDCAELSLVKLPSTLTVIENSTFSGCKSLRAISIPATVNEMGERAFAYCESLQTVTLPKNITTISGYLFHNCSSLASVTMLGKITKIGSGAFWGCGFTDFTVPDSVTELGSCAFQHCEKLQSIRLPKNGVTEIPHACFRECSSLVIVDIPDTVTQLDSYAFYDCTSLRELELPNTIKTISMYAFNGCSSLEKVGFAPDLAAIEEGAFRYCTSLKTFTIPNTVNQIANYTFYGSGLEAVAVPEGVTYIGDGAFSECANLKTAQLPDSLTKLDFDVFMRCTSLKSVNIPDGIGMIPYRCFYGCTSLRSIELPDGLTEIDSASFNGCELLTSIRIPDSLQSIGVHAFIGCKSLRSFDFPEGVTTISNGAFEDCDSLTTVTIPRSVQILGDLAFCGSDNLRVVYFEGDAPQSLVYGWFLNIEKVTIYYPAGNPTWTKEIMDSCELELLEHRLTWIPYDPPAAVNAPASRTVALATALAVDNVAGGEYTQETVDGMTVKTATYTDLIPGHDYLLLVVANAQAAQLLAPDNVLYVAQVTADKNGKLTHSYIQRTYTEVSFVMLCGGQKQDLSGATVTFPTMSASKTETAVAPVVKLNGKQLTEGVDYRLEGDVIYTKGGTYSCTIRGIYAYTGALQCSYTVADYLPGDVDGDKKLTTDDAVYLLLHVMFGAEDYPVPVGMDLNMDGTGSVTTDDAVYLLLHVMFGAEDYPLVG